MQSGVNVFAMKASKDLRVVFKATSSQGANNDTEINMQYYVYCNEIRVCVLPKYTSKIQCGDLPSAQDTFGGEIKGSIQIR